MSDFADRLKSLHTALIDSRNGYEEALEDAGPKDMTTVFQEMIALRTMHAEELSRRLTALGEAVDDSGSFMSTVHRTVISVRSAITGLDENILPALIDGEERIVSYYDEALEDAPADGPDAEMLKSQRSAVAERIGEMRRREETAQR
jgi:uncharacterized protein (TIGR02284 family)